MNDPARRILPMKAVAGTLPTGDDWIYEIKWDGMRAVVRVGDDQVRAHSARGNDITASFPELQDLAGSLGVDAVLDGELVALRDGTPSFAALQQRMHLTSPAEVRRRAVEVPVVFVIFDLLQVDGTDTMALDYDQRRQLLESLVDPGDTWRLTDVHRGDGQALLDVVAERHLEGLVAKRATSRYLEGRRSDQWIKIKPRRRQEFVVGGWASGEGNRSKRIGALLIGWYDGDELRFAGTVGSGLRDAELERLQLAFADEATPDTAFADPLPRFGGRTVTHLRPERVVEVEFSEWTDDGSLRHPVYLAERSDVEPRQVRREA